MCGRILEKNELLNSCPSVWILFRFVFKDFSVSLALETSRKSEVFMNCFDPVGNPKITIPSVFSCPLINVYMHYVKMILDVVGKYGSGDELLVDVRILLLSSLNRKPRMFTSFLNVLQ